MSHNSFGHLFRVTTWGESHGPALGCVVDGTPPNLTISEAEIQHWLDRRRPGQNRFTTQRQEPDAVKILSGVVKDGASEDYLTTGTPIQLLIENTDQRSKDYDDIKALYRPGHADYTYDAKYGIRDHRGGGRQSARETAARVAAGGIARKIIDGVEITGAVVQLGPHKINPDNWDWSAIENNPFWCPDPIAASAWEDYLDGIRKSGSSCGAVIEIHARNVPAGWGAPLYGKLDADLAAAMMSINAVKGVEIGDGFAAASLTGEGNADELRAGKDGPNFLSNHAGGILGGISSGQDIVVRFAVKPTSSILTPRQTVDRDGKETEIITKGRHDPCVGIRAVPVGEAMMACVLADHKLRHRGQTGR
jgi:chorismate synthase